jgi:hypothetical protein
MRPSVIFRDLREGQFFLRGSHTGILQIAAHDPDTAPQQFGKLAAWPEDDHGAIEIKAACLGYGDLWQSV